MRRVLFFLAPLLVFVAPLAARIQFLDARKNAPTEGQEAHARASALEAERMVLGKVGALMADARRLLEERKPETTDKVTLAVEDERKSQIHLVEVPKETFLKKGAEASLQTSLGEPVQLNVVRANGVNTAVRVADSEGKELRPLLVQYPIERDGRMTEVAYYASAHPTLNSKALARGGSGYVRASLDRAAERLASLGKYIEPEIIDAAERLCVVEHTDHKRFKNEDQAALYEEIYTLYALNAGETYRYSVSSAGAGGMVQMIPPTYKVMRERYPEAALHEDFVEGMRDHSNALQAMLLYMQDTWDDLLESETVREALETRLATREELLAAGYNSNPLRLPLYLQRGGDAWRTLIPEETQMYLRIYASVENLAGFDS